VFPCVALSALLLGLNLTADAIRDALDPRLAS
jgi:ABC-type dipeptide/oligopeptide/nickel transport system permease subunit